MMPVPGMTKYELLHASLIMLGSFSGQFLDHSSLAMASICTPRHTRRTSLALEYSSSLEGSEHSHKSRHTSCLWHAAPSHAYIQISRGQSH